MKISLCREDCGVLTCNVCFRAGSQRSSSTRSEVWISLGHCGVTLCGPLQETAKYMDVFMWINVVLCRLDFIWTSLHLSKKNNWTTSCLDFIWTPISVKKKKSCLDSRDQQNKQAVLIHVSPPHSPLLYQQNKTKSCFYLCDSSPKPVLKKNLTTSCLDSFFFIPKPVWKNRMTSCLNSCGSWTPPPPPWI